MAKTKPKVCNFAKQGGYPCNLEFRDEKQMCDGCRPYWTGPKPPKKRGAKKK